MLRIGILFEDTPSVGGAFYQNLNNIKLIIKELSSQHQILIVTTSRTSKSYLELNLRNLKNVSIHFFDFARIRLITLEVRRILAKQLCAFAFIRESLLKNSFEKFFLDMSIDIIFVMSPSHKSLYITSIPIVSNVWDLAHREWPEFKEAGGLGEWLLREEIFSHILPRSFRIITNSTYLRSELLRIYGLYDYKIKILPLCPQNNLPPSPSLDHSQYCAFNHLKPYVIYPAKFWPHKNHCYILEALALLRDINNVQISAIFVGNHSGTEDDLSRIREFVKMRDLDSQVAIFADFSWEQLKSCYENSLALVMPTYFGPTNIPVLEAFQLGVPVIYSDLPGFQEEYGNACIYVDLSDPNSLRSALLRLYKETGQSCAGVNSGHNFLSKSRANAAGVYTSIIYEFSSINRARIKRSI